MANEWRGEVALNIGGKDRVLRISQNDVADLEDELGGSIIAIMRRGDVGVRFVRAVIAQGLKEQVTLSAKQAGVWMGREPEKFNAFLTAAIKVVGLALRGPGYAEEAAKLDDLEDADESDQPPKEESEDANPPQAGTGPADSAPPHA